MFDRKKVPEVFSFDLSPLSDRVLDLLIADLDPQDSLAQDVRAVLLQEQRRRRLVASGQSAGEPARIVLRSRTPAEGLTALHELLVKQEGLKAEADKHRDAAIDINSAAAFYTQIFNEVRRNGMDGIALLAAGQRRSN